MKCKEVRSHVKIRWIAYVVCLEKFRSALEVMVSQLLVLMCSDVDTVFARLSTEFRNDEQTNSQLLMKEMFDYISR